MLKSTCGDHIFVAGFTVLSEFVRTEETLGTRLYFLAPTPSTNIEAWEPILHLSTCHTSQLNLV